MNYLRYTGVYIATAVGLAVLVWALQALFGLDISSSGLPLIPPMIGAMYEGQTYARTHGRPPESTAAWRFAIIATLISAAITALNFAVLAAIYPELIAAMRDEASRVLGGIGVALLVFFMGVIFLTSRYFLTFGAKNMLKGLSRSSDKT